MKVHLLSQWYPIDTEGPNVADRWTLTVGDDWLAGRRTDGQDGWTDGYLVEFDECIQSVCLSVTASVVSQWWSCEPNVMMMTVWQRQQQQLQQQNWSNNISQPHSGQLSLAASTNVSVNGQADIIHTQQPAARLQWTVGPFTTRKIKIMGNSES